MHASLVILALGAAAVGYAPLQAQVQTDVKIRLMAEALSARDRGDLGQARDNLAALLDLAPSDASVQRLLLEVNNRMAEERESLARSREAQATSDSSRASPPVRSSPQDAAAQEPSASRANAGMPVVLDEQSAAVQVPAGDSIADDEYSQAAARVEAAAVALARAEVLRLERTAAYINAQRELARLHARGRNYAAAVAALDAAMEGLATPLKELRAEREAYARRLNEKSRPPAKKSPFVR